MPKDYLFVPKGNVYVTRNCRKLTASTGRVLYVVYDDASHQQLGLRCPAGIYKEVKSMALASASKRQKATRMKDEKEIDKARDAIRNLFPKIPLENCQAVLKHSFRKGSGRVGRSTTLGDDKKVTLAVVAHIRHTMTPYEAILCQLTQEGVKEADRRSRARATIADRMVEVLRLWRGTPNANPPVRRVYLTRTSPVKVAAKSKSAPGHKPVEASAKAVTTRPIICNTSRPRHKKQDLKKWTIPRK